MEEHPDIIGSDGRCRWSTAADTRGQAISQANIEVCDHIQVLNILLTLCRPDELLSLSADPANLTDSPDLGPPPVAHFEEGDPINFDGRGSRRASRSITLSTDPRDPLLPANLETRRRRRESTHSKDTASRDVDAGPDKLLNTTTAIEAPSQPLKAGAKRKWNGKDEGEHPSKELEKDHFQFSRKEATASVGEKFSRSAAQKLSERPPSRTDRVREASKESSTAITSSSRRALGPKSANTDPQSPAKLKNAKTSNEPIATKENLAQKIRDRSQQKEKPRTKTPLEAARLIVEPTRVKEPDALASHEPETPAPAGLDLLSPTSTEPSARQEGRGDTPPPPDLGPGTGTGSFGRASRRPRGSISYAEPNLRDKMRRPTKELVDAVGAEERARQARAIKMDGIESALANIKLEDGTEPVANWQNVAFGDSQAQKERQRAENASPLGKKAPAPPSDLPSSVITNRRRRPSVLPRTDDDSSEPANSTTSGAASTIAALAKPRRRHDQTDSVDKSQQAVGQVCSDRTSIFDFTGSSPDASGKSLENKEEASRTSRSARRHSSVPALSDHGKGSLAISRRIRRESMA